VAAAGAFDALVRTAHADAWQALGGLYGRLGFVETAGLDIHLEL
jgi:hypothetical protein